MKFARKALYLVIVLTIALYASSILIGCGGKQQNSAVAPFRPPSTTSSDGKMTLGIMYFDNNIMSKDHDSLDRLRMGIVGALITELSKVQKLTVVEREKIDALRGEIEMQWKGDGFDQQTVQKFGKLLGAQALCFGSFMDTPFSSGGCSIPFYKKSTGEGQMRIDARIVVVETGAILKAEEITGQKQELFRLIKQLGLKVADRLETNLAVKVTPADKKAINTEDTVYTTFSLVKYEDARDTEKKAQISLEDASKLNDTLREAKELEAQRLFDDAKRKYEEALSISPEYAEAKKSIERLNQAGAM
jgi:TolB-like protein